MKKYLMSIIKKLVSKEQPRHLGRWRMEDCNIKRNSKIDLSNEDHCGPCGQYALEKIDLKNNPTVLEKINSKNQNVKKYKTKLT